MKRVLITMVFGVLIHNAKAQLYVGSDGMTIAAGESLSFEELKLAPTSTFTLTSTTLSKTEDYTINPVPGGGSYIKRYFGFSNTTPSFVGTIRFSYLGADLNSIAESNLRLNIRTNGTAWIARTDAPNTGSDYVESPSISSTLNTLTLASSTGALPVTWLKFTANKSQYASILEWSTANEKNSQDFLVQHSSNGYLWASIGQLNAAGNSSTQNDYSFTHQSPSLGYNYYRLLQRDLDGNFSYSKVVTVFFDQSDYRVKVYPNPVLNGSFSVQLPEATTVKLFDSYGRQLISRQCPAGMNIINVSGIAGGVYVLKTNSESISVIIK